MKNIIILLLSVILLNCTSNTNIGLNESVDLRNIIDKPASLLQSEIIESVSKISLETSDSILIKYITNVIVDNDLLYIQHGSICSIFDKSGKFLSQISRKGEGPEEYLTISQMLIDDKNILIYDNIKKKIFTYNSKGQFINVINSPLKFQNIAQLSDNKFIGYIPNSSGHETIKFGIFNTQGLLLDSVLNNTQFECKVFLFFSNEGKFFNKKNNLYFKEFLNDTIYKIDEDKLNPYLRFELGDKKAREMARAEESNSANVGTFFPNMAKINIIGETDRYLFLSSNGLIYYDKKDNISNKFTLKYENSDLMPLAISNDNKYLITYRLMDNDENPELILFKAKE